MIARLIAEAVALGPRPPWWRPIRRRRWHRAMRALQAVAKAHEMQVAIYAAWNQLQARHVSQQDVN